ncbi:hypothetical protein C9374_003378 [Naegleria lovaniensis]|uniref:Swi5-dependent recombination DNA repair protein 1 homolog n=1 Tax=Naegleria lovaniensis TaxID=51637 RepID=A0AA88GSQ4_NAELO|nr:uncharacterized protein C9374_003378 [Naegleria lovaniensis]KAG2385563.1 hypothetical protein C9374_003378 [Naegleria lovaniensis]
MNSLDQHELEAEATKKRRSLNDSFSNKTSSRSKKIKREKFIPPLLSNKPSHQYKFDASRFESELDYLRFLMDQKDKELELLKRSVLTLTHNLSNIEEEEEEIETATEKWLAATQEILHALQNKTKLEMRQILEQLNIEHDDVQYDSENDSFS